MHSKYYHSFIHLLSNHMLNAKCALDSILGVGITIVSKICNISCVPIFVVERDRKYQ